MTPKDAYVDATVHLIDAMSRRIQEAEAQAERARARAREKFNADLQTLRLQCTQGGLRSLAPAPPKSASAERAHCPNWPDPGTMD